MNKGQRADAGETSLRLGKQFENAAEILIGVTADESAPDFSRVFLTYDDCAGARRGKLIGILGIGQKADFISRGPLPEC